MSTDNQQIELTTIVQEPAPPGAMISAQRPVSRRVTAAAKELRTLLKDAVFPTLVRIVNDEKMPAKERVNAAKAMIDASMQLERLVATTETTRMQLEVALHGKAIAAKNLTAGALEGECEVEEPEDDGYPILSDRIIDV